jgi:hypothetical protein
MYPTASVVPDHIRAAIHAGHVGHVTIFRDGCGVEITSSAHSIRTASLEDSGESRRDNPEAAALQARLGWGGNSIDRR